VQLVDAAGDGTVTVETHLTGTQLTLQEGSTSIALVSKAKVSSFTKTPKGLQKRGW
jgi:hypothetical protein